MCEQARHSEKDASLGVNYKNIYFYPRANGAVPDISPGRGLLNPHGYLHQGKWEHSEVQSPSIIAGASLCFIGGPPTDLKNMADCQE